jgi:hypothetical protein
MRGWHATDMPGGQVGDARIGDAAITETNSAPLPSVQRAEQLGHTRAHAGHQAAPRGAGRAPSPAAGDNTARPQPLFRPGTSAFPDTLATSPDTVRKPASRKPDTYPTLKKQASASSSAWQLHWRGMTTTGYGVLRHRITGGPRVGRFWPVGCPAEQPKDPLTGPVTAPHQSGEQGKTDKQRHRQISDQQRLAEGGMQVTSNALTGNNPQAGPELRQPCRVPAGRPRAVGLRSVCGPQRVTHGGA